MEDIRLKGICRLSVVAIRDQPKPDAKMCSQLLFGEHYSVINRDGDWLRIVLYFDESEGWIHSSQHTLISEDYFNQVNMSDYKVCTDVTGTIFFQKKNVHILLGSVLPITTNELFKIEEQVAYNGDSKSLSQKREFEFMKGIIKHYMHAPYLFGGKSPFGIDEGALIQQVFKICGYRMPRTISEQAKVGTEIASVDDLKPGDLIYSNHEEEVFGFIYLETDKYVGLVNGVVAQLVQIVDYISKPNIRRVLFDSI